MVEALKKIDKKFLIMAGCIFFLPIVIIIFLAIIKGCSGGVNTHEKYEEKMISSAEKYFKEKNKIPLNESEVSTVKLSKLVSSGYIKSTEELLEDTSCKGEVKVRRNGASIEKNKGGFLEYTVSLICDEYKTTSLADKIKEKVVSTESGLYQIENKYVFRGDKVDNYIMFYGSYYRIISVDEKNVIKLVREQSEPTDRKWDNKFNVETNKSSGINLYKDSLIIDYLMYDYDNSKKFSTDAKKHILAYDVCVGKRTLNDYSISSATDCSEILENQVLSLLNVSDYAMASIDNNCVDLKSRSCNNYNYLYGIASSTWTLNAIKDNTYDVVVVSDGVMEVFTADQINEYNIVIYIDGNQKYTTGNGSKNDPYVIE